VFMIVLVSSVVSIAASKDNPMISWAFTVIELDMEVEFNSRVEDVTFLDLTPLNFILPLKPEEVPIQLRYLTNNSSQIFLHWSSQVC
jgi:hypothetical protein